MSANTENLLARLGGTSAFRPMTVATFTDWSLDVGDTITVQEPDNGSKARSIRTMPIFHSDMSWGGAATGTISSTGEEKRPVEKQADRDEQRFRKQTNKRLNSLDSKMSSLGSSVSSLEKALGSKQSVTVVTYVGSDDGTYLTINRRSITFYGSKGSESTSQVYIG